jgi:hypothetical protein
VRHEGIIERKAVGRERGTGNWKKFRALDCRKITSMSDQIPTDEKKECPLCNEFMKLELREVVDRIPGSPQEVKRQTYEWVCPECDYFEEDENAEGPSERPR